MRKRYELKRSEYEYGIGMLDAGVPNLNAALSCKMALNGFWRPLHAAYIFTPYVLPFQNGVAMDNVSVLCGSHRHSQI